MLKNDVMYIYNKKQIKMAMRDEHDSDGSSNSSNCETVSSSIYFNEIMKCMSAGFSHHQPRLPVSVSAIIAIQSKGMFYFNPQCMRFFWKPDTNVLSACMRTSRRHFDYVPSLSQHNT